MRAVELFESIIPDGITNFLTKKGYKVLGRGQDQIAYLEPGTKMVLKIFGTNKNSNMRDYTPAQRTFKEFADFCQKNPKNVFLPHFSGWETFEYEDQMYLQIRCERLFALPDSWGDVLEQMADSINGNPHLDQAVNRARFVKYYVDDNNLEWDNAVVYHEIISHLGGPGLTLFWDTIHSLSKIARMNGFKLDLHAGNFMLGSDGQIVISDPFFSGWDQQ